MTAPVRNYSLIAILYLAATFLVEECMSQVDNTRSLVWSTKNATNANQSIVVKVSGDPGFCRTGNPTAVTLIFSDVHSMEPLSFDYTGSSLYFAEWRLRQLTMIPDFFNLSSVDFVHFPTVGVSDQVKGVAVDWVSRLIYWADASNQLIGVLMLNTYAYWRPVVDSGLAAPQDVAVYAIESHLFWIDGGSEPKIERSILSGDNRTVLVSSASLTSPTTLEIDVLQKRLYWLDAVVGKIGSIYFNGSSMSFWTQSFISQVSAFTFFKDIVFFGYKNDSECSVYSFLGTNLTSLCTFNVGKFQGTIDMTVIAPENQPNFSSLCVSNFGGCDHFCYTMNTGRTCGCAMGFFLSSPVTCYTQPFEDKFLITTDTDQRNLFQVDLETGEVRALIKINFPIYPTAVDFDPISKTVFWFDDRRKSIMKSDYSQSITTNTGGEIVYTFGNGSVITGMVLDMSAGALLVVDSWRSRISQVFISTKAYRQVIPGTGGTPAIGFGERPTAIALDIVNRFVYWSKCSSGYSTIISTDMSTFGSHRTVVNVTDCISALTLDSTRGVLYWGTDRGSVETCSVDGTGRTLIHSDVRSNYTGFALDNSTLFMADNNRRSLQKLDRQTNAVQDFPKKVFTTPYAVSLGSISPPVTTSRDTTSSTTTSTTGTTEPFVVTTSTSTESTRTTEGPVFSTDNNFITKLIIGICVGVGGSVFLIVVIVAAVKISRRNKRKKSAAAAKASQSPLPTEINNDSIIIGSDVISLYDMIDDNARTERRYEELQPDYDRGYDQLHSSEDHALSQPGGNVYNSRISDRAYRYQSSIPQHGEGNQGYTALNPEREQRPYEQLHGHATNQPGREVYDTRISDRAYQSSIPQHGGGNLDYTTLNQKREQRPYEQLSDPYNQGYEHPQPPRDGETARYTGLRRTEFESMDSEQLPGNSGVYPRMMTNINPPHQTFNVESGGGNIYM